MGIMDFFGKNRKSTKSSSQKGITSIRYRGRWYGLMICLGEQSGRDMTEKLKDKGSEVLTMLEISNEFPEDFKYVNRLLALEDAKEKSAEVVLSDQERQKEYLLGAVEAKKVYLEGKNWDRLLADNDI
ncbi:MAG: hypothetical protein ACI4B4_01775 [Segatella copri]